MAPQPPITSWKELTHVSEEFDDDTGEFQYTMVAFIDSEDHVFYGELPVRRVQASLEQLVSTLLPVPDREIYAEWPNSENGHSMPKLTQAPTVLSGPSSGGHFVKRPNLTQFDTFKRYNAVHLLGQTLLDEAHTMEILAKHPHPNIIRYHGCCSQRGRLTGIVLDRFPRDLKSHLNSGGSIPDIQAFVNALGSAIHHLHSLGWAHNDLNPSNILVNEALAGYPRPILIDFGSARIIGAPLGTSRGTSGWIEGQIQDYTTSKRKHDLFALEKLGNWIQDPDRDVEVAPEQ